MENQTVTQHVEPFITTESWSYYKHPITGDIYRMPTDTNTAYDLITGMPLMVRWLCNNESFGEYKNLFMYYL
jgi:hypothetical protein